MKRHQLLSFAFLILTSASTASIDGREISFKPWRSPANGGINVLYCYLRVNGISCEYSDLIKEQSSESEAKRHTVSTLAKIASSKGLPLRPFSLTMDELNSCAKPVIVHMDGETPDAGAFLLLINMNDEVYFINGPSATLQSMSRENFRRVWSGIALLPVPNRKRESFWGIAGVCIGVIIFLCTWSTHRDKYS